LSLVKSYLNNPIISVPPVSGDEEGWRELYGLRELDGLWLETRERLDIETFRWASDKLCFRVCQEDPLFVDGVETG
jgi:hypothetical protein